MNKFLSSLFLLLAFLPLPALSQVQTANFVVTASTGQADSQMYAQAAEQLRHDMAIFWTGRELPAWPERCVVNIKVMQDSSGGVTSFKFNDRGAYSFRMSVQGSPVRLLDSVMPHEMSHTVFATTFKQSLPRWLDEGMATCVENPAETASMDRSVAAMFRGHGVFPFETLLAIEDYPKTEDGVTTLYAESYSTCQWLIQTQGKEKLIEFVYAGCLNDNWPAAIQSCYGYSSPHEMERAWATWVRGNKLGSQAHYAAYNATDRQMLVFTDPPNCGPCRQMEPVVQGMIAQGQNIQVVSPQDSSLFQQYHVDRIPTFVVLVNGQEVTRKSGSMPQQSLQDLYNTGAPSNQQAAVAPVGWQSPSAGSNPGAFNPNATTTFGDVQQNPTAPRNPPILLPSSPAPKFTALCTVSTTVADGTISSGNGVLVSNGPNGGYVVSVWHTFRGGNSDKVDLNFPLTNEMVTGHIVQKDEANDLVTIKIEQVKAQPVSIASDEGVPSGDLTIKAIDSSGQMQVKTGRVTGFETPSTPNNPDKALVISGMITAPGYSGAPIFNSAGQLVAIHWGSNGQQTDATYGPPLTRIVACCGGRSAPGSLVAAIRQDVKNLTGEQRLENIEQRLGNLEQGVQQVGQTASQAATTATQAQTAAQDANTAASGASTTAQQAVSTSTDAQSAANTATNTAQSAVNTAQTAQTTAATAQTTATTAQTTATTAQSNIKTELQKLPDLIVQHLPGALAKVDAVIPESVKQDIITRAKDAAVAALPAVTGALGVPTWVTAGAIGGPVGALIAGVGFWVLKRGINRVEQKLAGGAPGVASNGSFPVTYSPAASGSSSSTSTPNGNVSQQTVATGGVAGVPGNTFQQSTTSTNTTDIQPVNRDYAEAQQLLRLGQLEGRSPIHDAIAGRVISGRLDAIADSTNSDPAHAKFADDLRRDIEKAINTVSPLTTKLPPVT